MRFLRLIPLRPRTIPCLIWCLAWSAITIYTRPLSAQEHPAATVRIETVTVGFDGLFKVGRWTPVAVQAKVDQPGKYYLVLIAPDTDDILNRRPTAWLQLQRGTATLNGLVRTGRLNGPITVEIRSEDGALMAAQTWRVPANAKPGVPVAAPGQQWTSRPPLKLNQRIWATLGHPGGLSGEQFPADDTRGAIHAVELRSAAELPVDAAGYDGLDLLVVAALPEVLRTIDPDRNAALRDWVLAGGHLVVTNAAIGSPTGELPKGYAAPLLKSESDQKVLPIADWVPVEASGVTEVRQLAGLESYSGQNVPLRFRGGLTVARLPESYSTIVSGTFGPLVVRVPHGLGRVTVMGVDTTRPPLSTWPALSAVYRKLAGESYRGQQKVEQTGITRAGLTDLATQLHATQDEFPDVRRASYWQVLGWVVLVLAVVGPLDYLFVTYLLRRPTWTWVSLPMLVSAVAVLAVWSAREANGRKVRLNQLEILDVDSSAGVLRGRAWFTLFSPGTRRYDLKLTASDEQWLNARRRLDEPQTTIRHSMSLTWSAPPESAVGGLYRESGVSVSGSRYDYLPPTAGLNGVPITQWSTRTLEANWTRPTGPVFQSTLERAGTGRLAGTISHQLDHALTDVMLVYRGLVYFPPGRSGTLNPGQTWSPANARGLKAYLTGERTEQLRRESKVKSVEFTTTKEPYDPKRHEPSFVVRMLTFHESADGTQYTKLEHAALKELEVAPILDLDRAVLIGRMQTPALALNIDGEQFAPTSRESWLRMVLPVGRGAIIEDKGIPMRIPEGVK